MRGYFGIGVERISKPMNVGNLFRSAHAFGADFVFAISPAVDLKQLDRSDTSNTHKHVPLYEYATPKDLSLPKGCQLGWNYWMAPMICRVSRIRSKPPISWAPKRASYRRRLSRVGTTWWKIPTTFCVNVGALAPS